MLAHDGRVQPPTQPRLAARWGPLPYIATLAGSSAADDEDVPIAELIRSTGGARWCRGRYRLLRLVHLPLLRLVRLPLGRILASVGEEE